MGDTQSRFGGEKVKETALSLGKPALISFQVVGLIASAFLVLLTHSDQELVEERLQSFAISEVGRVVESTMEIASDQLSEGGKARHLGALSRKFGLEASALEVQREQVVQSLLANSLLDSCVENCEFWVLAADLADSVKMSRIAQLKIGQSTLQDFIVERYESSVRGLVLDLRRFGLVNVIALTLMIGLVVFRDGLNWRFAAFSVAVTSYSAWAAYGYVFGQNWALSILFQDWAAPGYQAGMIAASLLFFDWLFLHGIITQAVVDSLGKMLPG